VRPQRHGSSHDIGRVLAGNDHLDPGGARCHVLNIAPNLLLDALPGAWATEFGHHDRVAAHPDVRVDIAELNITKVHPNLPPTPTNYLLAATVASLLPFDMCQAVIEPTTGHVLLATGNADVMVGRCCCSYEAAGSPAEPSLFEPTTDRTV
jgi:hypothetical protein